VQFFLASFVLSTTGDNHEVYRVLSHQVDQIFAKWNKPDNPGAAVAILKNAADMAKQI
jgi:hypothetical protein